MSVDRKAAELLIRRLSRLKDYPRAYRDGETELQQAAAAESSLIDAACAAPSQRALEIFIADWERKHEEAPKQAHLYAAWRGPEVPVWHRPTETNCNMCGDSGWSPVWLLSDVLKAGSRGQTQEITETQYDLLLEKIREDGGKSGQMVYTAVRRCKYCRPSRPSAAEGTTAAPERRRGALQQAGRNE